jgi:hypothetical protein
MNYNSVQYRFEFLYYWNTIWGVYV